MSDTGGLWASLIGILDRASLASGQFAFVKLAEMSDLLVVLQTATFLRRLVYHWHTSL